MWFTTDQLGELIEQLIPLSPVLRVQQLLLTADELTLVIRSCRSEAQCPLCGQTTARIHSHYRRTLQDVPWGKFPVRRAP